jgi:hypothetical protein
MSFSRQNDKKAAKRDSRLLKYFSGIHLGFSETDQPEEYAFMSDFDCWQHRLRRRVGSKKNELLGYVKNVTAVFNINATERKMVGLITNGSLIMYPIEDVDTGLDNFYTWDEVKKQFTWDELRKKTWLDLQRKAH